MIIQNYKELTRISYKNQSTTSLCEIKTQSVNTFKCTNENICSHNETIVVIKLKEIFDQRSLLFVVKCFPAWCTVFS